jgi:hypothetical protein
MYGIPEAIDAYDGHVGQVGRLLREGGSQEDLVAYFSTARLAEVEEQGSGSP